MCSVPRQTNPNDEPDCECDTEFGNECQIRLGLYRGGEIVVKPWDYFVERYGGQLTTAGNNYRCRLSARQRAVSPRSA